MDFKEWFVFYWRWMRGLTIKFLEELPEEKLNYTPNKHMGSIGRHLRHVIAIQECYMKGFKTGHIDFDAKNKDEDIEVSKERLLAYAKAQDTKLFEFIENASEEDLDRTLTWEIWEPIDTPKIRECLMYMMQHEVFHQGELQTYARILEMKNVKFF